MPVLQPVVATLIANTKPFTEGITSATAGATVELTAFQDASYISGSKSGNNFGQGLGVGTTEKLLADRAMHNAAGKGISDDIASGLSSGASKIEEELSKSGKKGGTALQKALQGPIKNLEGIFAQFGGSMPGVVGKLEGLTAALYEAAGGASILEAAIFGIPLLAVAAVLAVVAVGGIVTNLAADFETSTNRIAASERITTQAAKNIGDAFLSTAFTTTFSANDMADSFAKVAGQLREMNGKALDAKQSLEFMRAATDLAAGSGQSLSSSTSAMTKIMHDYGIEVSSASAVSDLLFIASSKTGMSTDNLASSLSRLHGQLGINSPNLQTMTGLLVDMTNHGITGRAAIATLTQEFRNLTDPASSVQTALIKDNIAFKDLHTGALLPMGTILDSLKGKIQGMSDTQATATLKTYGFGNAAQKMVGIVRDGAAGLDAATYQLLKHGTAADAAGKAEGGLQGQTKTFMTGVHDMGTILGNYVLPIVKLFSEAVLYLATFVIKSWIFEARIVAEYLHIWKVALEDVVHWVEHGIRAFLNFIQPLISVAESLGLISVKHKDAAASAKNHNDVINTITVSQANLSKANQQMKDDLDAMGKQAGISGDLFLSYWEKVGGKEKDAVKALNDQAAAAGTTTTAMAMMASESGQSLKNLTSEINKATGAAESSMSSAYNIVSTLGQQLTVSGTDISNFYTSSIDNANKWTDNITKAIALGYDPTVISDLITAGPKQAGSIMEGLVSNFTPELLKITNQGAAYLSVASQNAIQEARMTQIAISSYSEQTAKDLGNAMLIRQQTSTLGTKATVQGIIDTLQISKSDVERIAKEYGLILPTAINNDVPAAGTAAADMSDKALLALRGGIGSAAAAGGQTANAYVDGINQTVPVASSAGATLFMALHNGLIGGLPIVSQAGADLAIGASNSAAAHDAKPAGKSLVSGIIQGVQVRQGDLNDATLGSVKNAIENARPFVGGQSLGVALGWGIWQGIYSVQQQITDAITDVIHKAIGTAKVVLHISSPSKVTAQEIGLPMAQGIAMGIADNAHLIDNAFGMATGGMSFGLNSGSKVSPLSASAINARSGTTVMNVTTPIQISGQTIAQVVTQYQLKNARATGTVHGQYGSGQTGFATQINTNAINR
jgi:TP901 family phage tail tape measure protein